MSIGIYVLHIVDDFGNKIPPCDMSKESFKRRWSFFNDSWED